MKTKQDFLPEARCQLTFLDPSVDPRSYIGKVVNVFPKSYDYSKQEMNVFIGDSLSGIIPLEELTIYDLGEVCYQSLSPFFSPNHLLSAEIIDFDSTNKNFILSRKKNMENALIYFSSSDACSQTLYAYKTGATNSSVFVDIGAGIVGLIPYKEISFSHVNALTYFKGIDYIPIRILLQNIYGKFIVSYKATVPYKDLTAGDIVLGRVAKATSNNDGIFIEINSNQSGIVNADYGLRVVQCNNEKLFIINEKNNYPARCIKENEKYLFAIKLVKHDGRHFKLSLL